MKVFSLKNKSGRSKTGRPLLKSRKKIKGSKTMTLPMFSRRKLSVVARSYKNASKTVLPNTKFVISIYLFSKHRELVITYKKLPYKGLRYGNSLNPTYLLSVVLITGGLAGVVYSVFDIKSPEQFRPNRTVALPAQQIDIDSEKKKQGLAPSKPKQVAITRLGIDYPVIELGQNPDETMETPPLFEKVTGWYKYSPTPGEIGPSIIVGHIDTYKGPSVFWRLREAQPGDEISVMREDGSTVKFKVTAVKQFEQSNFPTDEVYGNTEDSELRLITCGGTFDKKTLQYSENTVVFATMVR